MKEHVANALAALMMAALAFLVAAVNAYRENLKNKSYNDSMSAISAAVMSAVKSLQHEVAALKDSSKPGTWDAATKADIQKRAIELAKLLARPAIDSLVKSGANMNDISRMLMTLVESSVWEVKSVPQFAELHIEPEPINISPEPDSKPEPNPGTAASSDDGGKSS